MRLLGWIMTGAVAICCESEPSVFDELSNLRVSYFETAGNEPSKLWKMDAHQAFPMRFVRTAAIHAFQRNFQSASILQKVRERPRIGTTGSSGTYSLLLRIFSFHKS